MKDSIGFRKLYIGKTFGRAGLWAPGNVAPSGRAGYVAANVGARYAAAALIAFVAVFLPASDMSAQENAVRALADRVAVSKVQFGYSYVMDDGKMKMTGKGSVAVQGECYHMYGDGIEVWCDGSVVCTADDEAKEAVIEPVTQAGGAFVDPVALVRNVDREFRWDIPGQETAFNGVASVRYDLEPLSDSSDISGMKLYFRKTDNILVGAEIETVKVKLVFMISSFGFLPCGDESEFSVPSFGSDWFVTDLR